MCEYYAALSEGYSKLSLSKALCRYISLPITSDQLAQLVPGLGGDSICKLLGVFKTTPIEPLHNLMGIPPIHYLLDKILNAYTHRLRAMPPNALVCMVLKTDRCHIWQDYFIPPTNLHTLSVNIGTPTYRPIGPYSAGTWAHPQILYNPTLSDATTLHYKEALIHPAPSDTYIFCFHVTCQGTHYRCYLIYRQRHIMHSGCARGISIKHRPQAKQLRSPSERPLSHDWAI